MTREYVISITKSQSLNKNDLIGFLSLFCIERGKEQKEIEVFLNILINTGLLSDYFNRALEIEFKEKHIEKLVSKEGNLIFIR